MLASRRGALRAKEIGSVSALTWEMPKIFQAMKKAACTELSQLGGQL
jgi:hypothetical protein